MYSSTQRAQKQVNIPEGLPRQEHTPEQRQALGHSFASTQATQFHMPMADEGVLQHTPRVVQQAQPAQPMQGLQNVPVQLRAR